MDFGKFKEYALILRRELIQQKITPTAIFLFGSYAKKCAHKNSDIDLAVVSCQYGKNRLEEGAQLNLIASKIDPQIEAIPISLKNFMEIDSPIPIVYEVQKTGICLL
ncbi:MAG: nucleotidyltransferase domain-containing protein [Pseudomonadota bacterium]